MTRNSTLNRRFGVVSACIIVAMCSGMVQAGDRTRGGHGHRHSATCGCQVVEYAGRITIDGRSTHITSGRGELAQIAGAFRRAGYRARIHDGCLVVDYGYCKPDVRWNSDESSVQLRWGWDRLELSVRPVHRLYTRPISRYHREIRPVRRAFRYGVCR